MSSSFRNLILESGFLSPDGKQIIQKTLIKGLEEFFAELEENLSVQQLQVIKGLTLQAVADNVSSRMINKQN